MYQNIKKLYGKKLQAGDGIIGHVKDFYFDDQQWKIRYLVVETGTWLSERQVLLTHHAFEDRWFGESSTDPDLLLVKLTRRQIEESPSIDTHRPVSRQYEEEYHRYYGWPNYWEAGGMLGVAGFAIDTPDQGLGDKPRHGHNQRDDVHLRSTKTVAGYNIQVGDEKIGEVRDFRADGETWAIQEVVVETGHWYSGKEIFLLPENIVRIMHESSTVFVNLSKEDFEQTMKNEIASATSGRI